MPPKPKKKEVKGKKPAEAGPEGACLRIPSALVGAEEGDIPPLVLGNLAPPSSELRVADEILAWHPQWEAEEEEEEGGEISDEQTRHWASMWGWENVTWLSPEDTTRHLHGELAAPKVRTRI